MAEFKPGYHKPSVQFGTYTPLLGNPDRSLRGMWVRVKPSLFPNAIPSSWSCHKDLDEAIEFEFGPHGGIVTVTFHQIRRQIKRKKSVRSGPEGT